MRRIVEPKKFHSELTPLILEAKAFVQRHYGIETVQNVDLLCEKAYATRVLPGDIVECGVFQGKTLFPLAYFCQRQGIDKTLYGFDTFGGFPGGQVHAYDEPAYFHELWKQGRVSETHYAAAALRTKQFTDRSHLTGEYFLDVDRVFTIAKDFPAVRLIRGTFKDRLPDFTGSITLLCIDCDLYQSYKECLELLYERVVSGGVIIFDEYYSRKYPGARVAVDEFFADKTGHFEMFITSEGFERWCFIKA